MVKWDRPDVVKAADDLVILGNRDGVGTFPLLYQILDAVQRGFDHGVCCLKGVGFKGVEKNPFENKTLVSLVQRLGWVLVGVDVLGPD